MNSTAISILASTPSDFYPADCLVRWIFYTKTPTTLTGSRQEKQQSSEKEQKGGIG